MINIRNLFIRQYPCPSDPFRICIVQRASLKGACMGDHDPLCIICSYLLKLGMKFLDIINRNGAGIVLTLYDHDNGRTQSSICIGIFQIFLYGNITDDMGFSVL